VACKTQRQTHKFSEIRSIPTVSNVASEKPEKEALRCRYDQDSHTPHPRLQGSAAKARRRLRTVLLG
jgi:hypothetical protein